MLAVASHYVAYGFIVSLPVLLGVVARLCRTGGAETELSMAGQLDQIQALPEVER